ncbi:uncharacterized protein TRIADDRAFT_24164, partial [Trichoplax adhaerens]
YQRQWEEAQAGLTDLLEVEEEELIKKEKDRITAFQKLAVPYVKYIQIFRKLEQAYDQIVHPQKHRLLRHVLDGVIGRIIEMKHGMVSLELSEFHYLDDVLSDMKLQPADIEIPIPHYFVNENSKVLKEREKLLGMILAKLGPQDKTDVIKMTVEEAVRIVQIHERARQGRLRAKFMKDIRAQEERERLAATKGAPTMDQNVAASILQKLWRGYYQRKRAREQREQELIFLGMNTPQALAKKTEAQRRIVQDEYEREYQQAQVTIKDKLRKTEGPDMKERMQDQIRQWFIECRDRDGKFPDFPMEEEGGSMRIFEKKDPKQDDEKNGKGKSGKGRKGGKDKKNQNNKKTKNKDKKLRKSGKGKKKDDDDEGFTLPTSKFKDTIVEVEKGYNDIWKNRDESNNFQQKHDVELVKEGLRGEVEEEVRKQVDELMREELKNLKMAVERDKGRKAKGTKKGKKKKAKKGKKRRKKKREKDLTQDRTIESLYEELVLEGIVVRYPKARLRDFEGDYSYLGTTLRQENIEPMPSLSDVRRVITEYCILPLGSQTVHENCTNVKSILLVGPRGTGKKSLLHAICTEAGANLFDLTATNIAGKYPGKSGLAMLMHLVFKVARQLQPSVIHIGDAERTFLKKVLKNDTSEPRRLRVALPRQLRRLKAEDRVIVIGTCRQPYDAMVKPLCHAYQKILMIPRPDYASRFLLWHKIIAKNGGKITPILDISSLSKISDGYTPGQIGATVTQVLTERRLRQLAKRPLTATEFVAPLARLDPIYKEEEEALKKWFEKTPLGRKRLRMIRTLQEDTNKKGKKSVKTKRAKGKKK